MLLREVRTRCKKIPKYWRASRQKLLYTAFVVPSSPGLPWDSQSKLTYNHHYHILAQRVSLLVTYFLPTALQNSPLLSSHIFSTAFSFSVSMPSEHQLACQHSAPVMHIENRRMHNLRMNYLRMSNFMFKPFVYTLITYLSSL